MPRFIIGDSYGDVGNRELATDAQNDSRFFNWLAANRAQQEMADKARTGAENLQLSYDQLAAAQENQGNTLDYQNRALSQNADLFGRQLASNEKLANMQLLAGDKRIDRADTSQAYNEAYNAINKGDVTTPDELDALVGSRITPIQKGQLVTYLTSMFNKRQTAYDEGERARQMWDEQYQNRIGKPFIEPVQTLRNQALATPSSTETGFWHNLVNPTRESLTSKADALEKTNQLMQQPEEDKLFKALNQSKRLGSLIDFDPMTRHFVNLIPQPTPFGTHRAAGPIGAATPQPASPGQYPSPIGPTPQSSWTPVASVGVKVNPPVLAQIWKQANQLPTEADRLGFLRQALQKALTTGDAVKLAPPIQYRSDVGVDDPRYLFPPNFHYF